MIYMKKKNPKKQKIKYLRKSEKQSYGKNRKAII